MTHRSQFWCLVAPLSKFFSLIVVLWVRSPTWILLQSSQHVNLIIACGRRFKSPHLKWIPKIRDGYSLKRITRSLLFFYFFWGRRKVIDNRLMILLIHMMRWGCLEKMTRVCWETYAFECCGTGNSKGNQIQGKMNHFLLVFVLAKHSKLSYYGSIKPGSIEKLPSHLIYYGSDGENSHGLVIYC